MTKTWFAPATMAAILLGAAIAPAAGKTWSLEQIRIRDPFILADEATRTYYMYAQMTNRPNGGDARQGVEVYTSKDLQQWEGPDPVFVVPEDFWAARSVWAPEVHRYRGKYYLFVTFTADGGHGMIFKTFDHHLILALHQPNTSPKERAHLVQLQDTGQTLTLKP